MELIEKYQNIYDMMVTFIKSYNADIPEKDSLYHTLKKTIDLVKDKNEFKNIRKEDLKQILVNSLKQATLQFNDFFPEEPVKSGIRLLIDEEEPNEKFISIITERLRILSKQHYFEEAKKIIEEVIEKEWDK